MIEEELRTHTPCDLGALCSGSYITNGTYVEDRESSRLSGAACRYSDQMLTANKSALLCILDRFEVRALGPSAVPKTLQKL